MPKIIINNKVVNGIPLNEFFMEDETPKGLIFVQHGYLSNKERGGDYLALPLARQGYLVVCIDAFKHGERREEPFITGTDTERMYEVMNLITKTACDIDELHTTHYSKYETFDMIGVSLGGMVAYYLATVSSCVRKLIPVISTPDFLDKALHEIHKNGLKEEDILTEENREYINGVNPVNRMDLLQYQELFMVCGEKDNVVPMKPSKEWYETYQTDMITFKSYDAGHNVTRPMQYDIYEFIQK